MDADRFRAWVDGHQKVPKAYMDPDVSGWLSEALAKGISTSMDRLRYLSYVPSERQQGKYGNCWVWSGTALYEIMLSVNKGIKDRLSIQYLASCNGVPGK